MSPRDRLQDELTNALTHAHAARLLIADNDHIASTIELIYAQSALACARELLDEQRYQQAAAERTALAPK